MYLCHKWGYGGTYNHFLENIEMYLAKKSFRGGVGGGMEIVCVIIFYLPPWNMMHAPQTPYRQII